MGKISTLPGRSAPPRKVSSSLSKSTSNSFNPTQNTVKKSLKLESKRLSLEKRSEANAPSATSTRSIPTSINNKGSSFGPGLVNSLPPTNLSKSTLRRLKRKAKEQLAGNQEGLRDVEEAVVGIEEGRDQQVIEEEEETKVIKGNGKVGAKKRKEVLSQELLRQPSILKDPSFSSNPFQALRQHARNTLTFDGPVEKHNSGGKKKVKKGDEMEM